jgi:hypothetical protein
MTNLHFMTGLVVTKGDRCDEKKVLRKELENAAL